MTQQLRKVTRRELLLATGAAAAAGGGGLVLGYFGGVRRERWKKRVPPRPGVFSPSVFLAIDHEGTATVWVSKSEMGQGVQTALPMLVAEELELDWRDVRIEQAIANPNFGSQLTGNSTSVRGMWEDLRKAGATARVMLVRAAAEIWQVAVGDCHAERSQVVHGPSGRRLGYAALVGRAAELEVPDDVPLKPPGQRTLLGKAMPRLDTPAKVTGQARFGLDVRLPGMVYAMVVRPPVLGGELVRFDAAGAKAVPGVRDVLSVAGGVAVVGEHVWACTKGRAALDLTWDDGPHAGFSDEDVTAALERGARAEGRVARQEGDVAGALAAASQRVRADLFAPYLAHATMEPINCTAWMHDGKCEIWAPTQAPQGLRSLAAEQTGLDPANVIVHVTFLGGGFGRRAANTEAPDAIELAQRIGRPVQVVWTREDDVRHDLYRPVSRHLLEAGLDADGWPVAWRHKVVSPSILGRRASEGLDELAVDGAVQLPYRVPSLEVRWADAALPVPLGFWRSVGHSYNAFAVETFVDRLARAGGKDPVALRRRLLREAPRHLGVLNRAADVARWDAPPPPGRHRGVAVHASFGSYVAYVVEVSLSEAGGLRVHRVVAAVDCGQYVNPDTIAAQIEGGVVFGLSAALYGHIHWRDGRAVESNFHDYPLVRMAAAPEVEVHLVDSGEAPGGVGEIGVPPIAPAVANAVLAASGRPVDALPMQGAT